MQHKHVHDPTRKERRQAAADTRQRKILRAVLDMAETLHGQGIDIGDDMRKQIKGLEKSA